MKNPNPATMCKGCGNMNAMMNPGKMAGCHQPLAYPIWMLPNYNGINKK